MSNRERFLQSLRQASLTRPEKTNPEGSNGSNIFPSGRLSRRSVLTLALVVASYVSPTIESTCMSVGQLLKQIQPQWGTSPAGQEDNGDQTRGACGVACAACNSMDSSNGPENP